MKKREKIEKKIGFALAIVLCFSVLLTLASASLYKELGQLRTRGCNITDAQGVSFSKSTLINKFGLSSFGSSGCSFILDHYPFDPQTIYLNGYSPYYGEIKPVSAEGIDYILLLGKNEAALKEVVDLVASYENHELLLRGEYVLFYLDNYFRLYDQGVQFELPRDGNCTDIPDANKYTGNSVFIGVGPNITQINSSCVNEQMLSFPYCDNDEFTSTTYICKCAIDRCVATLSEVLYVLSEFERGALTEEVTKLTLESWIDNPDVSYSEPSAPPSPPPTTTSAEETATVAWEETTEITEQQFSTGYSGSLGEDERVEIEVEGESHYVGVVEVTETTVTIEVGSTPQRVTLSTGEVRKFEVTNDSYYDIYVQVNSIEGGRANLTIKSIYEQIPPTRDAEPAEKRSYIWIIGILILVVVVIFITFKYKKRK